MGPILPPYPLTFNSLNTWMQLNRYRSQHHSIICSLKSLIFAPVAFLLYFWIFQEFWQSLFWTVSDYKLSGRLPKLANYTLFQQKIKSITEVGSILSIKSEPDLLSIATLSSGTNLFVNPGAVSYQYKSIHVGLLPVLRYQISPSSWSTFCSGNVTNRRQL